MSAPNRVSIAPSVGITHLRRRERIAYVSLQVGEAEAAKLSEVLGRLTAERINLFFIKKSRFGMAFAVQKEDADRTLNCLKEAGIKNEVEPDCAVACVVDSNMKYAPGVMYRICRTLRKAGVSLLGTSDSFNSVSCMVGQEQIDAAMSALDEEFQVEESDTPRPLDPW